MGDRKRYTKEERELREGQVGDVIRALTGMNIADYRRRAGNLQATLLQEFDEYCDTHEELPDVTSGEYIQHVYQTISDWQVQTMYEMYGISVKNAMRRARAGRELTA